MQAKKFYQNRRLKWFRVYVNHIIENKPDYVRAHVSWWRMDDKTSKYINMDLDQEIIVRRNENEWDELDDSIEQKVFKHWRA